MFGRLGLGGFKTLCLDHLGNVGVSPWEKETVWNYAVVSLAGLLPSCCKTKRAFTACWPSSQQRVMPVWSCGSVRAAKPSGAAFCGLWWGLRPLVGAR